LLNRTMHTIFLSHCPTHQEYEDTAGTKKGTSCAVHDDAQVGVDSRLNIVSQVIRGLEGNRELSSDVRASYTQSKFSPCMQELFTS